MQKQGVILDISSLEPNGTMGTEAFDFIDRICAGGFSVWGMSSRSDYSVFAGSAIIIDFELLRAAGEICSGAEAEEKSEAQMLKEAYFNAKTTSAYNRFAEKNKHWLNDYALYMALRSAFGNIPWYLWQEDIRDKKATATEHYSSVLAHEIAQYKHVQYLFFRQWDALRRYAKKRNVRLLEYAKFLPGADSADVWANRELFTFESDGVCFDWDAHRRAGFYWLKKYFRFARKNFDMTSWMPEPDASVFAEIGGTSFGAELFGEAPEILFSRNAFAHKTSDLT